MDPDDGRRRRDVLIQEAIRTRPLGLRRFLSCRTSRHWDTGSQRLDLPTHSSLGRGQYWVSTRAAHLRPRPVIFGSVGHYKALRPSFLQSMAPTGCARLGAANVSAVTRIAKKRKKAPYPYQP